MSSDTFDQPDEAEVEGLIEAEVEADAAAALDFAHKVKAALGSDAAGMDVARFAARLDAARRSVGLLADFADQPGAAQIAMLVAVEAFRAGRSVAEGKARKAAPTRDAILAAVPEAEARVRHRWGKVQRGLVNFELAEMFGVKVRTVERARRERKSSATSM